VSGAGEVTEREMEGRRGRPGWAVKGGLTSSVGSGEGPRTVTSGTSMESGTKEVSIVAGDVTGGEKKLSLDGRGSAAVFGEKRGE